MHSLVLLTLGILGCTLVAPVITLLVTGNWRRTWEAWRGYCLILLGLAAPGIVTGLWMLLVGR